MKVLKLHHFFYIFYLRKGNTVHIFLSKVFPGFDSFRNQEKLKQ